MKKQVSFQIVLAATAIALLAGCAMFQRGGQSALVGNWTNSFGTVWAIRADGTFDVDLKHHGRRDAWGTYTVQGDQATFQRTGGVKTPIRPVPSASSSSDIGQSQSKMR